MIITSLVCSICDHQCYAPRLQCWDHLTNERIKLCSDPCLEMYSNLNVENRLRLGKCLKEDYELLKLKRSNDFAKIHSANPIKQVSCTENASN